MAITGRTIARLAQPFEGGGGPTHGTIERIWMSADTPEYLGDGNKMERVLSGLHNLREGRRAGPGQPALAADPDKLACVASELATLLVAQRLEAAGCPVDLSGNDWLDIERFPIRAVSAAPAI